MLYTFIFFRRYNILVIDVIIIILIEFILGQIKIVAFITVLMHQRKYFSKEYGIIKSILNNNIQ